MKPSGITRSIPWCILLISALCQITALKVGAKGLPTHAAQRSSSAKADTAKLPQSRDSRIKGLPDSVDSKLPVPELFGARVLKFPTSSCCVLIMCVQFMIVYAALAVCRTYHELTNTTKGQLEAALRAAAQTLTYGPMLCVLFVACRMRVEELSSGKGEPQAWVSKCMVGSTFAVLMSALLVLVIQSITGKPIRLKESPFDVEKPVEEIDKGYKAAFYALTSIRYAVLFALFGCLAGVIVGTCTYLPPTSQKLVNVDAPSPAVTCTMILAVVFFSTQFIIAVCRSFSEHTRMHFPQIVGLMHAAATTMEFAPMLSTLFLAAHMRAAQHDAELDDWVQNCMAISTGALCTTALLASIVPLTLCGTFKKNPWTNEIVVEVPKPTIGYIFIGLRYACMLCMYGSAAAVMLSIFIFESPGPMPTLPVSPAVQCVVNLTCQFFFVYLVVTILLTASELTGGIVPIEKWSLFSAVEAARSTLAFAPVLSMLFIATQMHAMMIGGKSGAPSTWVQDAMYLGTWSLQMAGVLCLATGLFMAKTKTDYDGNIINKFSNWYVGIVIVVVRYVSVLLMNSGMIIVMIGMATMTPESANGHGSMPDSTGENIATPFAFVH